MSMSMTMIVTMAVAPFVMFWSLFLVLILFPTDIVILYFADVMYISLPCWQSHLHSPQLKPRFRLGSGSASGVAVVLLSSNCCCDFTVTAVHCCLLLFISVVVVVVVVVHSVPGPPVVTSVRNMSSTALEIKWTLPVEPNGVIIEFLLCWSPEGPNNLTCVSTNGSVREHIISKLGKKLERSESPKCNWIPV